MALLALNNAQMANMEMYNIKNVMTVINPVVNVLVLPIKNAKLALKE